MKIDPTAAARVLLLNCADVGRVRIAKHKRQADGGIAARACVQAAAEQGQINTAGAQQPPAASPPMTPPPLRHLHRGRGFMRMRSPF